MSDKDKAKDGTLWARAKWKGFMNLSLNKQEKKEIKDNLIAEETGFEFLMNATTEGYKLSISYSIPEDVYTVSLTGQYRRRPNAGLTLSMRHRDLIVAVSGIAWCVAESGESGDWEERFGEMNQDDW